MWDSWLLFLKFQSDDVKNIIRRGKWRLGGQLEGSLSSRGEIEAWNRWEGGDRENWFVWGYILKIGWWFLLSDDIYYWRNRETTWGLWSEQLIEGFWNWLWWKIERRTKQIFGASKVLLGSGCSILHLASRCNFM